MDLVRNRTNLSIFMKVRPKRPSRTVSCESFMNFHESEPFRPFRTKSYESFMNFHESELFRLFRMKSYDLFMKIHENEVEMAVSYNFVRFFLEFYIYF